MSQEEPVPELSPQDQEVWDALMNFIHAFAFVAAFLDHCRWRIKTTTFLWLIGECLDDIEMEPAVRERVEQLRELLGAASSRWQDQTNWDLVNEKARDFEEGDRPE